MITWYMNDMKTLHVDRKAVSNTILCLEYVYINMHGTRGKRYEYLVMWMDYSKKGEVKYPWSDT